MEKHILENYINQNLSLNKISEKTGKSLTTIRYWAKKYKLESKHNVFSTIEYGEFRFCPSCEREVPTKEFYSKRGKKNASPYCKICTNYQTIKRQRQNKTKMVEYKGGKCENCGYSKCIGALEFHHKDPSKKDFTIAHARLYSFNEEIKKELDKCSLLCSNCHREEHEKMTNEKIAPSGIEPL